MSAKSHMENENIRSLIKTTGVSEAVARQLLESTAWDLRAATTEYFRTASARPVKSSAPVPAPSGGVRTISDLSKEEPSQKQQYYAGGQSSGIAVQDPRDVDGFVQNFFQTAQEKGAKPAYEEPKKSFSGSAHTLGNSEGDSRSVSGEASVKVIFWKNGFSVDEGPIRSYTDPGNGQFLRSIQNGEVPDELRSKARRGDLNVNLIDHKSRNYEAPKPVFKSFVGSGTALGSDDGSSSAVPWAPSAPAAAASSASALAPVIDGSQPTTKIQVRLPNGTRIQVTLNLTHTIADIKAFVASSSGDCAGKRFSFTVAYPQRKLVDDSKTIQEESLQNSALLLTFDQ